MGERIATTTQGRRWSNRGRFWTVLAIIIGTTGGAFAVAAAGAAQADTAAHYPTDDATGVPSSTAVIAHLDIGAIGRRGDFQVTLTDPNGQTVAGVSRADGEGTVSFTPDEPLDAGTHTARVVRTGAADDGPAVVEQWRFTAKGPLAMDDGQGGSILLIAHPGTSDRYLAEILRAEGIHAFDAVAPADVTPALLAHHSLVIVGAHSAEGEHVGAVTDWVRAGGDAITLRPTGALADLAGLKLEGSEVQDGYFRLDTAASPFRGSPAEDMQFKGMAPRYTARDDVRTLAMLMADRGATETPAVSLRETGSGRLAAVGFDLAASVISLRQGNPAWAGQERDGVPPIRPNDLFRGRAGERDHLDLENIGIPQADETMRALTALITLLHVETAPLPRLWYLPNSEDAAIVMTADDHGTTGGTLASMQHMLATDAPGCDPARWECARATSWLYPHASLTDDEAAGLASQGFDFGVHATTDCKDWTPAELDLAFERAVIEFRETFPSLPDQRGHRMHCIAYSDWLTMPATARKWGMRFDMNYYNWPADWIDGRPGYMTGSALPLRFADVDGSMINVFQQETHLVNESWGGVDGVRAIEALIAAARDDRGFVGAFGTHYDFSDAFDRTLMDVARRADVPMVSAKQMLDFTDGREASRFLAPSYAAGRFEFGMAVDARAEGLLTAMLPVDADGRELAGLTVGGTPVDTEIRTIRGVRYAFFAAASAADYVAVYEVSDA